MDDLSGFGKSMNLKSSSKSLGCLMNEVSPTDTVSLKCDVIDCPHYGNGTVLLVAGK